MGVSRSDGWNAVRSLTEIDHAWGDDVSCTGLAWVFGGASVKYSAY